MEKRPKDKWRNRLRIWQVEKRMKQALVEEDEKMKMENRMLEEADEKMKRMEKRMKEAQRLRERLDSVGAIDVALPDLTAKKRPWEKLCCTVRKQLRAQQEERGIVMLHDDELLTAISRYKLRASELRYLSMVRPSDAA